MNTLLELTPMEVVRAADRAPGPERKAVFPFFGNGIRLASDLMLLSVLVAISVTTRAAAGTIVLMELLFGCICALLVISRLFKHVAPVALAYLAIVGLAVTLNLYFAGMWGSVGLFTLCVTVVYRCPLRWSLPLAGACILALAATSGALPFLPIPAGQTGNAGASLFNLVLAGALCWFGWTLRTQHLLVLRLHEVQEQLKLQMARNAALATERERTRIARDIHDVLSHSLGVLSIQVQAARHLLTRDPARLAAKLDDMALLIRESIAESRHVVGLLREQPAHTAGDEDLAAALRMLVTTFGERTGMHGCFEESGTARRLSTRQKETLLLALREMLTNSHRHGAANTLWITLCWREADLVLTTRDDGVGMQGPSPDAQAREISSELDGHHGLRGMRERVEALGGEVEAGPTQAGGFTVSLRLPFAETGGQE